ncbi:uncharacterized protein L969DRAFT_95555 [Mixia osmundae IAM 14324]|uniref:Sec20 C-terminal domain-containing protein n=1 Tax=Mixia osmundae (strain CBS 9802 / IAM 14324 / JCM 22182 / KY 12970) TaxID=764103 RepID=G7E7R7_MIXOS|nr:uncharacterized protein L969DRAFT_95555 [Mixia osmundae IAM 14324]KEI38477.1 hypothetical protein L969DRAFT_95555 [Mixia osmundae IAM 14324]GAA98877.1 hypothetical protein E5Q_05565 [Mixia osmundae IAM 14324]
MATPLQMPPLPRDALQVLDVLERRLSDVQATLRELQPATQSGDVPDTSVHDLRQDVELVQRDIEELLLIAEEQEHPSTRQTILSLVAETQASVQSCTVELRAVSLAQYRASKKPATANKARTSRRRRSTLTRPASSLSNDSDRAGKASYSPSTLREEAPLLPPRANGNGRDAGTKQSSSSDDALMSATSDVTEGLRRTLGLMQTELDRSMISTQLLEQSSTTLTATSDRYSSFSGLLDVSKQLITSLQNSDFLDRLIILAALTLFGLVCLYILKRRVLDKGLRVAGLFARLLPIGLIKRALPSLDLSRLISASNASLEVTPASADSLDVGEGLAKVLPTSILAAVASSAEAYLQPTPLVSHVDKEEERPFRQGLTVDLQPEFSTEALEKGDETFEGYAYDPHEQDAFANNASTIALFDAAEIDYALAMEPSEAASDEHLSPLSQESLSSDEQAGPTSSEQDDITQNSPEITLASESEDMISQEHHAGDSDTEQVLRLPTDTLAAMEDDARDRLPHAQPSDDARDQVSDAELSEEAALESEAIAAPPLDQPEDQMAETADDGSLRQEASKGAMPDDEEPAQPLPATAPELTDRDAADDVPDGEPADPAPLPLVRSSNDEDAAPTGELEEGLPTMAPYVETTPDESAPIADTETGGEDSTRVDAEHAESTAHPGELAHDDLSGADSTLAEPIYAEEQQSVARDYVDAAFDEPTSSSNEMGQEATEVPDALSAHLDVGDSFSSSVEEDVTLDPEPEEQSSNGATAVDSGDDALAPSKTLEEQEPDFSFDPDFGKDANVATISTPAAHEDEGEHDEFTPTRTREEDLGLVELEDTDQLEDMDDEAMDPDQELTLSFELAEQSEEVMSTPNTHEGPLETGKLSQTEKLGVRAVPTAARLQDQLHLEL